MAMPKPDPSRYRSRSGSIPDVSGAAYQVFEEDERGTSRRRILKTDTDPNGFHPADFGGASNDVAAHDPPKPVAGAIAALTLVFSLCALGFAALSSAPRELLAGIAIVATISALAVAVVSVRSRSRARVR